MNLNLYTGVLLGAAAGTAVALLDKTTRQETGRKLKNFGGSVQRYKTQPSEAVRDIRLSYENIAGSITQKLDEALKLISTVQETIDMIDTLTGKGASKDLQDNSEQKNSVK